jgi:hypothetical protein
MVVYMRRASAGARCRVRAESAAARPDRRSEDDAGELDCARRDPQYRVVELRGSVARHPSGLGFICREEPKPRPISRTTDRESYFLCPFQEHNAVPVNDPAGASCLIFTGNKCGYATLPFARLFIACSIGFSLCNILRQQIDQDLRSQRAFAKWASGFGSRWGYCPGPHWE